MHIGHQPAQHLVRHNIKYFLQLNQIITTKFHKLQEKHHYILFLYVMISCPFQSCTLLVLNENLNVKSYVLCYWINMLLLFQKQKKGLPLFLKSLFITLKLLFLRSLVVLALHTNKAVCKYMAEITSSLLYYKSYQYCFY